MSSRWAENIGRIRRQKHLNQQDVEVEAKMGAGSLSIIESGQRDIKISMLLRIADVLGVRPEVILRAPGETIDELSEAEQQIIHLVRGPSPGLAEKIAEYALAQAGNRLRTTMEKERKHKHAKQEGTE